MVPLKTTGLWRYDRSLRTYPSLGAAWLLFPNEPLKIKQQFWVRVVVHSHAYARSYLLHGFQEWYTQNDV